MAETTTGPSGGDERLIPDIAAKRARGAARAVRIARRHHHGDLFPGPGGRKDAEVSPGGSCPRASRRLALAAAALFALPGCGDTPADDACVADGQPLHMRFFAHFPPVSHSASEDPGSPGFRIHTGYEADLLTALEAIEGARLSFDRSPVTEWEGIWLLAARPEVDIVGGGITILESRTRDASGKVAIAFTSGHIAFRQSLLVRAADRERFSSYGGLTRDARAGVLRATTGEARLLAIAGIVDGDGVVAAGTRIETPGGTVLADGTDRYVITAARASPVLDGRIHLFPPSQAMPQVVYMGDQDPDREFLEALRDSVIDVVARGHIGNAEAAHNSDGRFVLAALDTLAEHGGFVLDRDDLELRTCIDERIEWLTHGRRIGYVEWRREPAVFLERARLWPGRAR